MSTHLAAAIDWWLSTIGDAADSTNQSQTTSQDDTNSSLASNQGYYGASQPLTWPTHSVTPFRSQSNPEKSTVMQHGQPARSASSWPPSSDIFVRAHSYSPSNYSEPFLDTSSSILNSGYRSTWELLKSLPAPTHMMQILPTLPTHYFTPAELNAQLPDPVCNPIPLSMFDPIHPTIQEEYSRVLDLRECLRVEEITIEMKSDMDRLYLDPPQYHAYQERLGDVRVLLMRACQSLAYIEAECAARGLNLDTVSINERRIANRQWSHPFYMIAMYLKPDALKDFNNFEAFSDATQLNRGDAHRSPLMLSTDLEATALTEERLGLANKCESDDSSSAYDTLASSHYSLVLGTQFICPDPMKDTEMLHQNSDSLVVPVSSNPSVDIPPFSMQVWYDEE